MFVCTLEESKLVTRAMLTPERQNIYYSVIIQLAVGSINLTSSISIKPSFSHIQVVRNRAKFSKINIFSEEKEKGPDRNLTDQQGLNLVSESPLYSYNLKQEHAIWISSSISSTYPPKFPMITK